jgi:uncharacterized protein involved in exopolysaccharide biosynthesis/protein involved in polysaccharide export with SLBB domain
MENNRDGYLLEDILLIFFKHKFKILAAFFTVMVAVTIKTHLTPKVYETHSSLMVQSGKESLYRPEAGGNNEKLQTLRLDTLVNTEAQILTSTDLIEEIITDLGVGNIYPDMIEQSPKGPTPENEALIKNATFRFRAQLTAAVVKGSNVISVSFKHNDPQVAARAVNQLIESFKVKHIELFRNPRTSFMEKQLAAYRQKLDASEESLEAFKQKNQVYDLEEQKSLLLTQKMGLDVASKDAQSKILELQQRIASLASQMQTIPKYELAASRTGKTKNIDDAQNALLQLQLKEQELLAKYDRNNRKIANVRKEIQLITDFLSANGLAKTNEDEVLQKNNVYAELETSLVRARTDLSSEEARLAATENQLNQVNGELQDLDAHERELRNLERELTANESNFENFVAKLEDARIEEELDLMRKVNIAVIQKATVPIYPIAPNKRFNLLVGVILGAAVGLVLAIFSEYCVGRGVCTPEGVEQRLGLPILAAVPYKEKKNSRVIFAMVTFTSLFLLLFLITACSTAVKSPTPFNPRVVEEPSNSIGEYKISANDTLEIKFFYNPELNESVQVRPDGRISLQFANDVMAGGLTPAELTDILTEKYSADFVDPMVTVMVRSFGGQMAYVDGEVRNPGMIDLNNAGGNITVSQSISQVGGLEDTARRHEVRVIRRKADKKPLVIPVNLAKVYNGADISQDIVLQPYDIVYVPKSTIANVNMWANQYLWNNVPIGFGYSIDEFFWE